MDRLTKILLLATTAIVTPTLAAAAPIGPAIAAIGAFLQSGTILATIANIALVTVAQIGVNALFGRAMPSGAGQQRIDAARVNTRIPDASRWMAGGTVAAGGEAGIFGEHDEDGNFWYIVAHADSEITADPTYILDGIEVELSDGTDGFTAGDVITDAFCLTDDFAQYVGTGNQYTYFRLYTVTPDAANVYGALPSDFTTAFPNLPSDFYLAGVAYTIVRCRSVPIEHYNTVMHWTGVFRLGEPTVTAVANFSRMYDPREAGHDIEDPDTWTASDGNPAIIWAWFRTTARGRGRPTTEINWDEVTAAANVCDELVEDRTATEIPRYRCGVIFSDSTPRHECEAQILRSMDAFVAYDDQGRAYPVPGYYEAPSLEFTAERDILTAQTEIVDDGEAQVDGVIVEYISPDHNWQKQSSAPWVNPNYYDGTSEPRYQTVEILACQNHNQAVRLAKAMGLRAGASKRAGLGTSIKGILAKSQRAILLEWDDEFSGEFEIVSPVKEDSSGQATTFTVAPLQTDRWDLNMGEEGAPPALTPALNIDTALEDAANVVITSVSIATAGGAAVRIEATFDAPSRPDRFFRFRYAPTGTTTYQYFTVDMEERLAFSAIVDDGATYDVQWQTITAGGRATEWGADIGGGETVYEITAVANPTAPGDLVAFAVTAGGTGEAVVTFSTANDPNQASVAVYRGTTTVFGDAALVSTIVAPANTDSGLTETGLSADIYYYWAIPLNQSGIAGNTSGPESVVVT